MLDNQKIKEMALENGFKLKQQADGTLDLNPYVYDFARAIIDDVERDSIAVSLLTSLYRLYSPKELNEELSVSIESFLNQTKAEKRESETNCE